MYASYYYAIDFYIGSMAFIFFLNVDRLIFEYIKQRTTKTTTP